MTKDRVRYSVVLIHEFAGSPASVGPVADALRAHGAVVETPTLPGHDTRWEDLGSATWQEWYAACDVALTRVVVATGRPAVVAGVSVGAALALRLAAIRGPEVAGVVAVNAALHTTNRLMAMVPVFRHVIRSIPNEGQQVHRPETDHRRYDRLHTAGIAQLGPLWKDVRSRLDDVHQPVTIVRSLSEGEIALDTVRLIREGISSTQVEELVLERSGHVATIDYDAPLIAEAIEALLRVATPR